MHKHLRSLASCPAMLLLLIGFLAHQDSRCQEAQYIGTVGDAIDYRTGELTYTSTDVTVAGKRGLSIVVSRHYSSARAYSVATVDRILTRSAYSQLPETSGVSYLGQGWNIEPPYLETREISCGDKQ